MKWSWPSCCFNRGNLNIYVLWMWSMRCIAIFVVEDLVMSISHTSPLRNVLSARSSLTRVMLLLLMIHDCVHWSCYGNSPMKSCITCLVTSPHAPTNNCAHVWCWYSKLLSWTKRQRQRCCLQFQRLSPTAIPYGQKSPPMRSCFPIMLCLSGNSRENSYLQPQIHYQRSHAGPSIFWLPPRS